MDEVEILDRVSKEFIMKERDYLITLTRDLICALVVSPRATSLRPGGAIVFV